MSRRAAREAALQILYKIDIAGRDLDVESELTYWLEELAADGGEQESGASPLLQLEDVKSAKRTQNAQSKRAKKTTLSNKSFAFALELIHGALAHTNELDEKINGTAREWNMERMDVVDRNLMRLALYEMFFCPTIPQRVSVNEAVELAKTFCGDESANFINGILDRFIAPEER